VLSQPPKSQCSPCVAVSKVTVMHAEKVGYWLSLSWQDDMRQSTPISSSLQRMASHLRSKTGITFHCLDHRASSHRQMRPQATISNVKDAFCRHLSILLPCPVVSLQSTATRESTVNRNRHVIVFLIQSILRQKLLRQRDFDGRACCTNKMHETSCATGEREREANHARHESRP
jgi:hypothetical protein